MVKTKYFLIYIILFILAVFTNSCNFDILGVFTSSEIDDRLKERNNFVFLDSLKLPPAEGDYKFLVLTDTHIEDTNAYGFENIQTAITENGAEFIVVTGDITQNGAKQDIDRFLEIANSLSVPCYPVIGNHDIYFGNWDVWKEKIGSTNYRIDTNDTTLLILDSANAFYGKNQLDWLENELKTVKKNVFVFTHSNLFASGIKNFHQSSNTDERAQMISLLNNKADIVFMGHSGKTQYNKINGVEYIVIDDFYKKHIYCLVSVTSSGIFHEYKYLN